MKEEGLGRGTWLGKISAHKVGRGWVEMGRKGTLAKEGGMGGAEALSGKEGLGWWRGHCLDNVGLAGSGRGGACAAQGILCQKAPNNSAESHFTGLSLKKEK